MGIPLVDGNHWLVLGSRWRRDCRRLRTKASDASSVRRGQILAQTAAICIIRLVLLATAPRGHAPIGEIMGTFR